MTTHILLLFEDGSVAGCVGHPSHSFWNVPTWSEGPVGLLMERVEGEDRWREVWSGRMEWDSKEDGFCLRKEGVVEVAFPYQRLTLL